MHAFVEQEFTAPALGLGSHNYTCSRNITLTLTQVENKAEVCMTRSRETTEAVS